jgi:hypothetical protein
MHGHAGAVMSDISDVLTVLAKTVAGVIYPELPYDVIDQKWDSGELWDLAKGKSVTGADVRVYPGWPVSNNLDDDLVAGISHVTVFPKAEERNTTRYPERNHVITQAQTTLTLTISGPAVEAAGVYDTPGVTWDVGDFDEGTVERFQIRVGGTVTVPQNLALRINGSFYVYSVQATDTLEGIASRLAVLVSVDLADCSAVGPVITLGPTARLQAARVGGFGTTAKELRRQERVVQIIVWANAPGIRDTLAGTIDVALAGTRFIEMPDGFGARLIYKSSMVVDALQKAALYRRDLNYTVEYATTISKQRAAVIAPSINYENRVITF